MRPIHRATVLYVFALHALGILIGTLVRPVAAYMDTPGPPVSWGPALMFFGTAMLIGVVAWTTWQALHKKNQRMTSDHGVKLLALSRASLIVGAVFAGAYGGYALAFVRDFDTPLGADRVIHAGFASGAAFLLVIAALLLERACRIPGGEDDDPLKGTGNIEAAPA